MSRIGRTIALCMVVAGCPAEEPPKSAAEAERSDKTAKPDKDGEKGRYGPKTFALPEGCGPKGEKFACNPLTNAGCNAANDEACDDDDHGAFACFPDSDGVKEGAPCDDKSGPSCAVGLTCDGDPKGVCRKFCCAASDCAAKNSKCVPLDSDFGALGVCK